MSDRPPEERDPPRSQPPAEGVFRTLLDEIPLMLIHFDREGRVLWVNRCWRETLGLSLEETRDGDFLGALYPDPAERRRVEEFIAASTGEWDTFRPVGPEGRVVHALFANVRLPDHGNVGIGVDRSEVVAAERRSEALFTHALDAILLADDEGRYVDANPAACQMLGYEREELLGMEVGDVLVPAERHGWRGLWEEFLRAGTFSGTLSLERRDGTPVEAEHRSVARVLPGVHASFSRDVSEQVRATQRLRASEARFREVFEHAALGIAVTDSEGRIVQANPALCRLLERSRRELVGALWSELTHPADLERERPLVRELLGGERTSYSIDKRYLAPDGDPVWTRITASRLPSGDPASAAALALVEDIGERRRMEEERSLLVREIRDLSRRLTSAEQAERKRLAAELHDRVGSNLGSLALDLGLARSELAEREGGPEALDEVLERAEETLAQVARDVRNVMAELRPPVLDDYGLVATLRWLAERSEDHFPAGCEVRGEEPEPRLPEAVEITLVRVAEQALANAVRHAEASRAEVSLEVGEVTVRLVVADDGVGFHPAARRWSERGRWGLVTMRERMEGVGGRLRIESAPGGGTRVVAEVER